MTNITPLQASILLAEHTRFSVRIYYEDTDSGGYVYHASYLRFAERARTEALRAHGINQREMYRQEDLRFVVASCTLNFKAPAFLDDVLFVHTYLQEMQRASITLRQEITRDNHRLVIIHVTLACVNGSGKPVRIPLKIKEALRSLNVTKES